MKAVIVDDEKLARQRLRLLLDEVRAGVEVIGEAAGGAEAVQVIDALRPDLVFLDVEMPEVDGFQVLARTRARPLVIFVTAYDDYALRAFDEDTVDYLLKPVEPERLTAALAKLRRFGGQAHPSTSETPLDCIAVPIGGRTLLLRPEEVLYFAADNKYTRVCTAARDYLIDVSLTELERRLSSRGFLRIHRATLVNLEHVREVYVHAKDRLRVVLRDAARTELDVGRSYIADVRGISGR